MQDWKDALAALTGLPEDNGTDNPLETISEVTEKADSKKKLPKLQFFYEKKGRAGKPATIITGFSGMSDAEIADIARRLKQMMGCGGSERGGEILLQGDRREKAREILKQLGFK